MVSANPLNVPLLARIHQRAFAALYRLHEEELGLVSRLRSIVHQLRPDWPEPTLGIDVGAGLAPYGLRMLRHCRDVVLIEPNRLQAAYLSRTLGGRAHIIEAAVSDRPGSGFLVDDAGNRAWRRPLAHLSGSPSQHSWHQRCAVDTVDGILERLDLLHRPGAAVVKIDVEGRELQVLHGMTRLLAERPALVIAEIVPQFNPEWKAVFDFFESAGFDCLVFEGGRLAPGSYAMAEAAVDHRPSRFSRFSRHHTNFVFLR